MPSHLTRHVFRALVANEPIFHRGCLRQRNYITLCTSRHPSRHVPLPHGRYGAPVLHRRTFFNMGFLGRNKREIKDAELDPGIEKMTELVKRQRMRARLPAKEEVAEAFTAFVRSRFKQNGQIKDTQAELLLRSLKYCTLHESGEAQTGQPLISSYAIHWAASVLKTSADHHPSQHHVELAQALFELPSTHPRAYRSTLAMHIRYLAFTGQLQKARELVDRVTSDTDYGYAPLAQATSSEAGEVSDAEGTTGVDNDALPVSDMSLGNQKSPPFDLWFPLVEASARGSSESDLLENYNAMRKHMGPKFQSPLPAKSVLAFYIQQGNAQQIQKWFTEYWQLATKPRRAKQSGQDQGEQAHRVLSWCLQNQQLDVGHAFVRQLLEASPLKPVWDAIFVWAAGTGKGVDEIARMFHVMEDNITRSDDQDVECRPDVATINALVEFAVSKNDPYTAERFITLGRDRGIAPNARTYVLQMEYRLRVKDVDGALVAYKSLQALDLSSNEDVITVNRLLVALCQSQRHDFDTLMNVAADLTDRKARFEPPTVSALSVLHLNRDEFDDVVDLLNTHVYDYSSGERDVVRAALFALCIDPSIPTARSWDAYTLIRRIFDETPRSQRTEIMLNFFKRERSDMAIQVFNNMRTQSRPDNIPTTDTYVAAFMATAKLDDIETLEIIHNQLKLDFNINVNTYLNNALMIAYSACGQARQALDFWNDIVASKEGPTYNSIHIALRACEKSVFGDTKAREIWDKLRRLKVELDQKLWASYVGALAGNGNNQLAFTTVEEAEAKNEVEVDSFLIGSLFAGGAGQSKQKEIEEWAQARYPHVWEELLNIGIDEDEAYMRNFRIDRTVTP